MTRELWPLEEELLGTGVWEPRPRVLAPPQRLGQTLLLRSLPPPGLRARATALPSMTCPSVRGPGPRPPVCARWQLQILFPSIASPSLHPPHRTPCPCCHTRCSPSPPRRVTGKIDGGAGLACSPSQPAVAPSPCLLSDEPPSRALGPPLVVHGVRVCTQKPLPEPPTPGACVRRRLPPHVTSSFLHLFWNLGSQLCVVFGGCIFFRVSTCIQRETPTLLRLAHRSFVLKIRAECLLCAGQFKDRSWQ